MVISSVYLDPEYPFQQYSDKKYRTYLHACACVECLLGLCQSITFFHNFRCLNVFAIPHILQILEDCELFEYKLVKKLVHFVQWWRSLKLPTANIILSFCPIRRPWLAGRFFRFETVCSTIIFTSKSEIHLHFFNLCLSMIWFSLLTKKISWL